MSSTNYTKYKYLGKKFPLKDGGYVEIIEYRDYRDVDVRLNTGEILYNLYMHQIKNGIIQNPYKRTVFNRGYFGVGKYNSKHIFYTIWQHMMYRCYSPDAYKTYINAEVDEKWFNYQTFAEWCEQNYVDGFALDKDILSDKKIYSENTCCFVPQEINNQFFENNFLTENFGIRKVKNVNKIVYRPRIRNYGKEKYLGTYNTLDEAKQVYKEAKENYLHELAEEYKHQLKENVYNILKIYKF